MRRGIRAAAHADVRGSRTADVSVKAVAARRGRISCSNKSATRHVEGIARVAERASDPINERKLLDVVVLEGAVRKQVVQTAQVLNEDTVLLRLVAAVLHGGVKNLEID